VSDYTQNFIYKTLTEQLNELSKNNYLNNSIEDELKEIKKNLNIGENPIDK